MTSSLRRPIPEASVERLSLYARELGRLDRQGIGFISSKRLGEALGLTDAKVRRDLSYVGQFGKRGRGYEVLTLQGALSRILGIEGRAWSVALAGVGNLGSALLAYRGFQERGFVFRVAVDADQKKVGQVVQGVRIAPSRRLSELARQHEVHIGILTVPSEVAQEVCDQLVAGGVRAIVNFAPAHLEVPPSVRLRNMDLAIELEALAFYLGTGRPSRRPAPG